MPRTSPDWILEIIGSGVDRARLEKLSQQLGIADRLRWVGVVPSEKIAAFYRRADCTVLPSRWDGWGMTVNEALRESCPVLVSQTCGAASAVPADDRLPDDVALWPGVLFKRIEQGAPRLTEREGARSLARSLTAEAGVSRLHEYLQAV